MIPARNLVDPVILGIAGGTRAGKTTLVEALAIRLQPLTVARLRQDDYLHSLPAAARQHPLSYNFDHPRAFDLELLVAHLQALRLGAVANPPVFDRRRHVRDTATRTVAPAPLVVVEGLHVLAIPAVRACLDVAVFIDTPSDVRLLRRLEQDNTRRGRSWQEVATQYLHVVRPMHEEHVRPSRTSADLVVSGYDLVAVAVEQVCERLAALLHLAPKWRCDASSR